MGGHHPRDESGGLGGGGGGGGLGAMGRPPPSHDPSAYEFQLRYNPTSSQGNTLTATARSDGFMTVGWDWRVAPWLDLHVAGQFFQDNAASFIIADIKGRDSNTQLRMIQQTNFEASYVQRVVDNLYLGASLQYDSASFWTSSSFALRYYTRYRVQGSNVVPSEIVTLECGTVGAKEQSLAQRKPGESPWSTLTALQKQMGFLSATYWSTMFDNYRVSGSARVTKETETKWRTTVKLGMEYATQLAVYKGVLDPFNYEICSEVKEEITPGVTWSMCAKINYWDQTYRFGAMLGFQT